MYLRAGLPLKDARYFESFCQIENGVGMIPSMRDEFLDEFDYIDESDENISLSIATGYAAYGFICFLVDKLKEKYKNLKWNVYKIENRFFGENITVAGLVTGSDLVSQLKTVKTNAILITECMLRSEKDRFLDDMTLEDASRALGKPIIPVGRTGEDLLNTLLRQAKV